MFSVVAAKAPDLAQQRLGRVEGNTDVLRLQRQGAAEQLQSIGVAPQLVGAHPLTVELDRLLGAAEDGRVAGQFRHALQHLGIIAVDFHAALQQRLTSAGLAQLLELAGHRQCGVGGKELAQLLHAGRDLGGQLRGTRHIAALAQQRISRLHMAWNSLGVWDVRQHLLTEADRFEMACACKELDQHLYELARECMLLAEDLPLAEQSALAPLWAALELSESATAAHEPQAAHA